MLEGRIGERLDWPFLDLKMEERHKHGNVVVSRSCLRPESGVFSKAAERNGIPANTLSLAE